MLHIFCFHLFLKMYCTTEFCCLDNFNTQYELLKVWREREREKKKEGERKRERQACHMLAKWALLYCIE